MKHNVDTIHPPSNKQDAAQEPECSHVERFCKTNYLNSLLMLYSD